MPDFMEAARAARAPVVQPKFDARMSYISHLKTARESGNPIVEVNVEMAYRMLTVDHAEDGSITNIKDYTAVASFDWKKLVTQKSKEEGTDQGKELDALLKV